MEVAMPVSKKLKIGNNTVRSILVYTAIACGINVVFFLIINHIDFIHFGMNDDFYAQNLLSGAMGGQYLYFKQINIALGGALAGLYSLSNAVNWYGVFLFAALLASCGLPGGILMDKFGLKIGIPMYIATIPFFFGMLLYNITFTLVSYALLTAGVLCLVYAFYIGDRKAARMLYILSAVAGMLSMTLRMEAVATAAVYFCSVTVLMLLRYKKQALKPVLTVAVMFAAIGALLLADNAYYNSSEELKEYDRFNAARTNVQDKAPLDYERYSEAFSSLGWTPGDVEIVRGFYFPDNEKFDAEALEAIYASMEATHINSDPQAMLAELKNVFSSNNSFSMNNVYLLMWIFMFMAVAFATQRKKLFKVYSVFLAALPFLFHILFVIIWRVAFRVTYPHYVISAMLLMMFVDVARIKPDMAASASKRIVNSVFAGIIAVAAVGTVNLFINIGLQGDQRRATLGSAVDNGIDGIYEYVNSNPDKAFVYTVSSSIMIEAGHCYSIFDTFPRDYFKNLRMLGGWDSRSPSYNDFKERYGLDELPEDLLNNNSVYLITPQEQQDYLIASYFANNYGINVEYQAAGQLGEGLEAVEVRYDGALPEGI